MSDRMDWLFGKTTSSTDNAQSARMQWLTETPDAARQEEKTNTAAVVAPSVAGDSSPKGAPTTPQSAPPTAPLTQGSPGASSVGGAGRPASTETRPMGYGGGGTAGGGGDRGGRADTRAGLQRQLNALDEAAAYVTTTEQSDGIEQQRRPIIEQLRQMDEEEGRSGVYTGGDRLKNTAANTKLIAQQGLTIADHTIAQTADWLFGGIAKEGRALLNTTLQSINPDWGFENEDPLITQYNKKGAEALAHNQAIAEKRIEEGKLDPTVWKYGTQVVAAIPDAVLALLTYGSSTAAQATTKSLEAASRLARGGKLYQKVAPLVQSTVDMMKSPQWMSAFARSAGSSYEAALADGATEEQATLYALVNSYANATIEVGGGDEALGGIQKLPKQLQEIIKKGDSSRILAWIKSTGSEVFEESLQGILERGLRTIYSDDVPLYAREDPNAIINPKLMLEEAKGAFITGSLLSGGQAGANAIHRALQTPARVNVDSQTLTESENIAALPEKVTAFPADPGDLETLNQETRLALNQDWDKPEYSPYVDNNSLQNNNQHVSISDIQIHKSLGAKAKNYDVIDPTTGEFFQFAEGTKIQNAEVFAGYSTKKPLNETVADGLSREFGGDPSKWQHAKGIGTLDYYGEEIKAEVHWFQEESIGKVKFKVKEWKE